MAGDVDDTVVRAPSPAPAGDPLGPHDGRLGDGDTIPGWARPGAAPEPVDAPVPPPPAQVAPRPFLRLPSGEVVALDRAIYLGRRPSLPRVHTGAAPLLVTVSSPGRLVSATHLSITALGGTVVARDMLSTNGTVIRLPGSAARTLLRGESAVLIPGTMVDLGDGNVLEVLPG